MAFWGNKGILPFSSVGLLLIIALTEQQRVAYPRCDWTGWAEKRVSCPSGTQEAFTHRSGDVFSVRCCSGSPKQVDKERARELVCKGTGCLVDKEEVLHPCTTYPMVIMESKTWIYKEKKKEYCVDKNGKGGVKANCCPEDYSHIMKEEAVCTWAGWKSPKPKCPKGTKEAFSQTNGEEFLVKCCSGSPAAVQRERNREAQVCKRTECLEADYHDPCATIEGLIIPRKTVKYNETMRDECKDDHGEVGVMTTCCPSNSAGNLLLSLHGAEINEFPHMGHLGGCGATVYNKDYVLTAAHCMVDDKTGLVDESPQTVLLGTNVQGITGDNLYEVEEIIVHYDYSKLANQSKELRGKYYNDLALLKLKRSIDFSSNPNIKAIPIAPENFDPLLYADNVIIVGWGTTIENEGSEHLLKANLKIRTFKECYLEKQRHPITKKMYEVGKGHPDYADRADDFLCIGGVVGNSSGPTAGRGDSGGPAICRDKNGNAVLCGITSFGGPSDELCGKLENEENCQPSMYAAVSKYHDWIEGIAGKQDPNTFYKVPVYGKKVGMGKYFHQVHITSVDGTTCGGTLISQDTVVTAAHCIVKDDREMRPGIEIATKRFNLNQKRNEKNVFGIREKNGLFIPDGFKKYSALVKLNIEKLETIRHSPYYDDIAVVKLDGSVNINPDKLAKLPEREQPKTGSAVELAFPLNTQRDGSLMSRNFNVLDAPDCKTRLSRLEAIGVKAKFDTKKIFCGVEKYSGGGICDREDGGALLCKNDEGQEELCGIQTFRMCRFSIPSAFLNVRAYRDLIHEALEN